LKKIQLLEQENTTLREFENQIENDNNLIKKKSIKEKEVK